jgi:LacI family transcriptional regulator
LENPLEKRVWNFSKPWKIKPGDPFASVNIDNERAAYDATKYLIDLGHRDIAMISGYLHDLNAGLPRLLGYKRALEEVGFAVRKDRIFEGDFAFQSGYQSMKCMLESTDHPSAIFAASDMMAMGAARAILETGLKIPDDISIIGFDGLDNGAYFYPAITTVEQPRYDYGYEGLKILLEMLTKEYIGPVNCEMQYTILERESCCAFHAKRAQK